MVLITQLVVISDMKKDEKTYIAGWKTPADWNELKPRLLETDDKAVWESVYNDYYLERITLRYFKPISVLQENGTYLGEGFSIVAILCSLVEFLETTIQGLKYKFVRNHEELGKYEYSSSKRIFIDFLSNRRPFSDVFDGDLALDFYGNIRCGLLHEATTKNGWRIWAKDEIKGKIIDPELKVVYRNNLCDAFDEFIEIYKSDLLMKQDYKDAFIRKFDSLCE